MPLIVILGVYTAAYNTERQLIPSGNSDQSKKVALELQLEDQTRIRLQYFIPFKYYALLDAFLKIFE